MAVFEAKLDTNISKPNLDFYLENDDAIISFENKFTECCENNLDHCNINLDKYYKIDKLNYLPKWFMEIMGCYLNKKEKMNMDVAQLIKYGIGLIKRELETSKKSSIVYILETSKL